MTAATAHLDSFVRDNLPPPEQWPTLRFDLAALEYPERVNCAGQLLDGAVAEGHGGRTAFISSLGTWTYEQLLDRSNQIAHALVQELGVVPGTRILLRAPNHAMLVACWYAIVKAGGVAVTTMPLLRARELAVIARKARIQIALCDTRLRAELEAAARDAPSLRRVVCFGVESPAELDRLAARKPVEFENVETAADDPCLLAFTSGTTGQPKATVHFHRDVLAVCDCVPSQMFEPTPADVFCGSPPLGFTFGMGGLVWYPMSAGASSVLLEQPSPRGLLGAIRKHRPTICYTAPTVYRRWLNELRPGDLGSLRACVSSGEALPAATWRAFKQATGIGIINSIGSTEMLHSFMSSAGSETPPGSLGKPIRGYEACLLDGDGKRVPVGETGRLAVRGPTGCRYLDDERQALQVYNGWTLTGDLCVLDADGNYWYRSRGDDMIISAGYNIAGAEVEAALLAHPAVSDCAVVGAPDPARGAIVKAFVVLDTRVARTDSAVAELQLFVKQQIAPYKYPRAIEFVDDLPRTPTGKLQRFKLRQRALRPPARG